MESEFDFGVALEKLKDGQRVKRGGWNGPNQWIAILYPDLDTDMTQPYIYIKSQRGDLIPWLASQADVLGEDWITHHERQYGPPEVVPPC